MIILNYRILLRKEPEGGYTVIVPLLPGCVSCGETIEEAIDRAKEAIELFIESLKEHGEIIPTEERVSPFEGMVRGPSMGSEF
ncbi:MAG: type II toxin-antitoxin system HicB family antitoxin [Desulfobacterales bacterium]|nr:type II toxin-antitoxin system HicB family antitoxin [Desulfobacterales bacterium]